MPSTDAPSTDSPCTDAPCTDPTVADLTSLLFDGDDRERVHGTWSRLIASEEFTHRPGLAPAERVRLSYDRLRVVNSVVDDATELARDPRLLASMHEWTGVVDGALGTLAGIHYNLFLGSLIDHDPDGERDLTEFTSLLRTGTFLCTELAHGNDAVSLGTTAELDRENGGFVLNTPNPGAQKFMPNTSTLGGPKSAVVAARLLVDGTDQGIFLFLTPLSDVSGLLPGVTVRRLPERTGSPVDHCLTSFDRVRLPREALLETKQRRLEDELGAVRSSFGSQRKRFLHSIGRVTAGKMCMSAAGTGVTRAALALAVRYAHHRFIGGPKANERVPLTAHRSHHAPLVSGLADAYAMTFLHRSTLARWTDCHEEDRAAAERQVAVTKGWVTWQARRITVECRERCGAQGLFAVNGLSEFPLNLEGAVTAEGDNLVIWLKAASELLFESRPAPRERPEETLNVGQLSDLGFLRDLLARTEIQWQARARKALRGGPRGNPLDRWNAASSPALQVVGAHAHVEAADAFLAAVEQATEPGARSLLEKLCRLFLLQRVTPHTGDLLAEDHMSAAQVRALPETVDALIAELAPHMRTLVDAFALPEGYLASIPLANETYIADFDRLVPGVDPEDVFASF
ncbi:acyl-CoA dehydrogenase [Streptomyces sp. NPDC051561]|uniref:acyl-CoA dehydrogenase family protein n=1 Tax=Streptomyces sp. NPDC051561 TaxID=3365658 RepID=UPI0037B11267